MYACGFSFVQERKERQTERRKGEEEGRLMVEAFPERRHSLGTGRWPRGVFFLVQVPHYDLLRLAVRLK